MTTGVRVRQLTMTFGTGDLAVHAVKNVDLDIAPGEVVLVMGPSGSGKTTLLLMLGAMLRPTSGSIELANDPTVILADEPTANLDASMGRDIARLLRRLATDEGRSVVIVSHDARLREIADRVLWLEDGTFRELTTMATDPVCRMPVEAAGNPSTTHTGTTWWFCSPHCRDEFDANPEPFLTTTSTT